MQARKVQRASAKQGVPPWVSWALLVGAGILALWGWFLIGFLTEPSAVGRSRVALMTLAGSSIGIALLALVSAAGLVRQARWAPRLALVASVFMTLSGVAAIAGVPAAAAILSRWNSLRT